MLGERDHQRWQADCGTGRSQRRQSDRGLCEIAVHKAVVRGSRTGTFFMEQMVEAHKTLVVQLKTLQLLGCASR
jgi:hypothetical protein